MSIATAAKGTPLGKPLSTFAFVDIQTGNLTDYGAQLLSQYRNFIVGMNRVTPCDASGKNVITLTPLDASPLIEKYVDYEIFAFVADQTSDASVTMTVVPRDGTLSTLKAYKTKRRGSGWRGRYRCRLALPRDLQRCAGYGGGWIRDQMTPRRASGAC
jgi:hypothetical protein